MWCRLEICRLTLTQELSERELLERAFPVGTVPVNFSSPRKPSWIIDMTSLLTSAITVSG